MKNFTYCRPTSPEQAVALLEERWGNTELLAGGTDLLDRQKEFVSQPARVVSLGGVAGMEKGGVRENPPEELLERFEGTDRHGELLARVVRLLDEASIVVLGWVR